MQGRRLSLWTTLSANISLTRRLYTSTTSSLMSLTKVSAMPSKAIRFSAIHLFSNSDKVLCESPAVTLRSSSNFNISRVEMNRKKLNTVYIYQIMEELIVVFVAFSWWEEYFLLFLVEETRPTKLSVKTVNTRQRRVVWEFHRAIDVLASIVILSLMSSKANSFLYTYKVDMWFTAALLQCPFPLPGPLSHLLGKGGSTRWITLLKLSNVHVPVSLFYIGEHIFCSRAETDRLFWFWRSSYHVCNISYKLWVPSIDARQKGLENSSSHIFRITDLFMLFAAFFSAPFPSNAEHIFVRKPTNSLMGCLFISSFIFPSTFLLTIL